jgi:transposase
MAIVQLRHDTDGRAHYRRKIAAGKTSMEAMRCLKRRLSDAVYRQMLADAAAANAATAPVTDDPAAPSLVTGPGGQAGTSTGSSADDSNPDIGASENHFPDPSPGRYAAHNGCSRPWFDTEGSQIRSFRGAVRSAQARGLATWLAALKG